MCRLFPHACIKIVHEQVPHRVVVGIDTAKRYQLRRVVDGDDDTGSPGPSQGQWILIVRCLGKPLFAIVFPDVSHSSSDGHSSIDVKLAVVHKSKMAVASKG